MDGLTAGRPRVKVALHPARQDLRVDQVCCIIGSRRGLEAGRVRPTEAPRSTPPRVADEPVGNRSANGVDFNGVRLTWVRLQLDASIQTPREGQK